jgi:hypothetical protein
MPEFLFKSDLTFTTIDSSGARAREVQAHQMRQFTSNMLEFLFKIGFNFYHHGQFRNVSGGSSGAPNAVVHYEHARTFI